MPSEALQNVIELLAAAPLDASTPIADQRAGIDLLGAAGGPVDGVTEEAVDAGGVPAVWLTPDDTVDGRTVLYLHGGGYNIGSIASHRGTASHLAVAAHARVLLVDYRLAPEHRFPAALEDALIAYRWLLQTEAVEPTTFVVAGESAGGGLTMSTLVSIRDDEVLPLPACAVLISPWLDLTHSGDSNSSEAEHDPMLTAAALTLWAENYAGDDLENPLVSPLFADASRLPPLLAIAAEHELLRDDTVRFAEQARASGIDLTAEIVPGVIHAWTLLAGIAPEGDDGLTRVAKFIDDHT